MRNPEKVVRNGSKNSSNNPNLVKIELSAFVRSRGWFLVKKTLYDKALFHSLLFGHSFVMKNTQTYQWNLHDTGWGLTILCVQNFLMGTPSTPNPYCGRPCILYWTCFTLQTVEVAVNWFLWHSCIFLLCTRPRLRPGYSDSKEQAEHRSVSRD